MFELTPYLGLYRHLNAWNKSHTKYSAITDSVSGDLAAYSTIGAIIIGVLMQTLAVEVYFGMSLISAHKEAIDIGDLRQN